MNLLYFIRIAALTFSLLLTACAKEHDVEVQGYIEGLFTYVSPNFSGMLKELLVARGTQVKAGQLLYRLDPQPESDMTTAQNERQAQAAADQKQALADFTLAKVNLGRSQILYKKGVIAKADLDTSQANYDSTAARLKSTAANFEASKAAFTQATWSQTQKTLTAPRDALVFDTYYRLGELVSMGRPVVSLLSPQDVHAIFYVGEKEVGGVKLNDVIRVTCDGCAHVFEGKISFISPTAEYSPPVIYSTESRDKLVFRIEAAFSPEQAKQLHPGQPVTVEFTSHG